MKINMLLSMMLLSTAVQAEPVSNTKWSTNDNGIAAVYEKSSPSKVAAVIKCNDVPHLFLYDTVNYRSDSVGNNIPVKLRVDRMEVYTTTGTLKQDGSLVALHVDANDLLFQDMIKGSTLRVVFKISNSERYGAMEQYSLSDFTSTVKRSKDQCAKQDPSLEYFPDDGDFF